jgi:hypothetical protein
VHNVRVRSRVRGSALPLAALTAATALALGGCSLGGDDVEKQAGSSPSASASSTPSSTVQVPQGVSLTDQGSKLSFGHSARVLFETTHGRGTVLGLTVESVRRGTLKDFKGFILDDAYKRKAAYYYAHVVVKNVGKSDVGGVPVPLWGVNGSNTLLPAVNFTTRFPRCPSKPLPKKFGPGDILRTCLVYLSPNKGSLVAVSYRPTQDYNPITWTGTIQKPPTPKPKPPTPKPQPGKKSGKHSG